MGCGSFMTEFGAISGSAVAPIDSLNYLMDLSYKYVQSFCYWQYKKYNDFTTVNAGEAFWADDGTFEETKVKALTRAYPQAVAGTINSMTFNATTNLFTLVYTLDTSVTQPTDIYVNTEMNYAKGFKVSVIPSSMVVKTTTPHHVLVSRPITVILPIDVTVTITAL
eukprot:TRINITY_DN186_c0_g1_i4.p1 TRINITY_DN186_c0_g1~~TRINITY_DN186_c0_g1_i4.p1  ORF type:complete len:166 (+),score=65.14 TRINITY_DN186_c0_g1_i4:36-533(+)